jgi:hypothetical protein
MLAATLQQLLQRHLLQLPAPLALVVGTMGRTRSEQQKHAVLLQALR